jgi:hypothetical protein
MSSPMTTSAGSIVTSTGPSGAMGTFIVPATASYSFAVSPAGPTFVLFAGTGAFEADAVVLTGAPPLGKLILCFFIRPEHQAERLASYEERFNVWRQEFGARKARRLYYRWALQSIFDILTIGVIGAVIDWIYDRFSGK